MGTAKKSVLALNLKRIRKMCGLTQSAVADALGIERSRYAHYENSTAPSTENLKKLAKILNTSVDELLAEPDTTPFVHEGTPNTLWETYMMTELKTDEKSLVIKYRLLSNEDKMEMLKTIEEKIKKSED